MLVYSCHFSSFDINVDYELRERFWELELAPEDWVLRRQADKAAWVYTKRAGRDQKSTQKFYWFWVLDFVFSLFN